MGEYYGLSVETLCKLMQFNGQDGMIEVNKLGGVEEICEKLGTSPANGVGNTLEHRRATFGINRIPKDIGLSFIRLLCNVCCDPIVVLMLCSVLLYLYYGISLFWFFKFGSVVVIVLVTLIVNVLYQRRFQHLLDNVNMNVEVTVIRNAIVNKIHVEDIVVGDVCLMNIGDIVPADGILIESNGLIVDESSQTGHSGGVKKSVQLDPMLFSGTKVVDGSGTLVVVAVGVNTRKGVISSLLMTNGSTIKGPQTVTFSNEKSIIQQKVLRLYLNLLYVLLIASAIMFVVIATWFTVQKFIIERHSWQNSDVQIYVHIFFSLLIIIIVYVLPDAITLPLTVTIVLALTAKKLFGDNKLVRSLHSSETMGNVTSICFDKTGTLTNNRMEIVRSYICENQHAWDSDNKQPTLSKNILNLIAHNISINSAVSSMVKYCKDNVVEQTGNGTECALLGIVKKFGLDFQEIRERYSNQLIHTFPFNSNRKLMGTVIRISNGGYRLLVKGAADKVLTECKFVIGQNDKLKEMTNNLRDQITSEVIKPMTSKGLRTISLAYRDFVVQRTAVNETPIKEETDWTDETNLVKNLTFLGVFGMTDIIRSDVPELISRLHTSGITLRMVTGDDINTALSVATQCGIISDSSAALDAAEFNKRIRCTDGVISQHLFDNVYPTLRVLARASPTDKYNLVNGIIQSRAKNNRREIVAMIGDGDSDALALKRADVGITFNLLGTDIAKNASDIILKDNQIGGIINAVLWGRHAYDSIAKFTQFMLHAELASLLLETLTVGSVFAFYFSSYMLCALFALAPVFFYDPIEDVDQTKPHERFEHLLSKNMIINIVGQSIYQILAFFTFIFCHQNLLTDSEPECLRYNLITFAYNTFIVVSLFATFNARSLYGERNVFRGIRFNFLFIAIWILAFAVQIIVIVVVVVTSTDSHCEHSTSSILWAVGFSLGLGILIWQQLLFFCNRSRKVKKNYTDVRV